MTKLAISICIGFTVPILLLTAYRIVKLFLMASIEFPLRRGSRGGLVATHYTCSSTTSTSSTHPPPEEGDYCDIEFGGTVSGRHVTPRECRNFQNIARGIAGASFTARQAAQALAALGRAGSEAGRSLRDFQTMMRSFNGGIVSEYDMGYVDRVLITMNDGNEISIDNARVEIHIDQETLDHTSLGADGVRNRRSVTINEERRVSIGVGAETFFDTIRLIRED